MTYTAEEYRVYQKERYHERVALARDILGRKCYKCGSKESLQIDHVDPQKKKHNISYITRLSMKKFRKEIEKCQLLCMTCHGLKTIKDKGQVPAKGTHGTLSAYRYCKCDKCKKAARDWSAEYHKKNRDEINRKRREKRKMGTQVRSIGRLL